MSRLLVRADGVVEIVERTDGKRSVTARPVVGSPLTCVTAYPVELIERIVDVKGVAWVCDEILRDEDLEQVQRSFMCDFLPYLTPDQLPGKRILDFGCGAGASTMVLARMFPASQIVGVELMAGHLEIARRRQEFYGYKNITFRHSPDGTALPEGLGQFDVIVMSAVFEHLLPDERTTVMPLLWAHLSEGGTLLLNQTPHRFFPFESHTTGLPLINYLPDRLALYCSRRFSKRSLGGESWESLLRKGIRGATEREILASLGACPPESKPALRAPPGPRYRDRVDVWYAALGPRHRALKAVCREFLRGVERSLGTTWVVNLVVAISKGTPRGYRA